MSAPTPSAVLRHPCHGLEEDIRTLDLELGDTPVDVNYFQRLRASSVELRMAWLHVLVHGLLDREHEYMSAGHPVPDMIYTAAVSALCHVVCPTTGSAPTAEEATARS